MHQIKYRTWFKGIPPRRIKLEVPGWAGEVHYKSGQPWHCKPFVQGSTYGLELLYPFDTEVSVTTKNNELVWTGDFTNEREQIGQNWDRPFASFAPGHFGFTSSVDVQTVPGMGTMILPHPRFYTDRTGTVPLPVAGMLETAWWPRVFFIVFKSPLEGQSYVFRKGEPYAQLLILPLDVNYDIKLMTEEEAKIRIQQDTIIANHAKKIASQTWFTEKNEMFDNKYKKMSSLAKHKGNQAVGEFLEKIEEQVKVEAINKQQKATRVIRKRRII